MSFSDLTHVEGLARMAGQFDGGDEPDLRVSRWGPASWWRAGIAVLAFLIAVLLVSRWMA